MIARRAVSATGRRCGSRPIEPGRLAGRPPPNHHEERRRHAMVEFRLNRNVFYGLMAVLGLSLIHI